MDIWEFFLGVLWCQLRCRCEVEDLLDFITNGSIINQWPIMSELGLVYCSTEELTD